MAEPDSVSDAIARAVFGRMFECGSDGHFIVDRNHGRIMSANVHSAELLSRTVDELVGSTIDQIAFGPCDLTREGRHDYIALRRADNRPVFVTMTIAHVEDTAAGYDVLAYTVRDTAERSRLDKDLITKHSALFAAHSDLETAYTELREAQTELESKNHDIAMLAYHTGVNELVGSIAHNLNNPLGALHSMIRSVDNKIKELPPEHRDELDQRIRRITNIAGRLESNVNAIVTAGRTSTVTRKLPPQVAAAIESAPHSSVASSVAALASRDNGERAGAMENANLDLEDFDRKGQS